MLLVPNQAIRDEGGKPYVYGIERKDGPLGNAVYVRKIYVTIIDANESVSAVAEGLFVQGLVITESSKPNSAGYRIRIRSSLQIL